jgi:hypothetical protein
VKVSAPTFWACAVPAPKQRPECRLATAIELAGQRGIRAKRIHVNEATAAETKAPAGVTLVPSPHVPRDQFRFERDDA